MTNVHAKSHRSFIVLACSSRVSMSELALYFLITQRLTVFEVTSRSCLILTVISDLACLDTALLDIMISCKIQHGCIHDMSNTIYKSCLRLHELLRMWTRRVSFLIIILDMYLLGVSIFTAEVRKPAAMAFYVLFVDKFFAIH